MILILRETHEAPAFVAQALARAGGVNRFGEPNFRAVWGWSRLAWIGGRFEDRDAAGNLVRESVELRYEPKYFPRDRWHIERWCAPEMYGSPDDWTRATLEVEGARSIAALGPYPSRGEYEHVFTLEGPVAQASACAGSNKSSSDSCASACPCESDSSPLLGAFIQLTPTIVERLARMIEMSRALTGAAASAAANSAIGTGSDFRRGAACRARRATGLPAGRQGREALYRREAARDRAYDSFADSLLHDSGPAFHGVPHAVVPAKQPTAKHGSGVICLL
ncbi:MAG: hypothetical protein WAM91_14440 [Candidatus Acidiferrales bacterium]